MEDPVGFLRGQAGGVDTERADHTFELLHRLILQGGLERAKQRKDLRVGLEDIEDRLVVLVQERQDMRHVRVLAQPVGRLNEQAVLVHDPAREPLLAGLPVSSVFRI